MLVTGGATRIGKSIVDYFAKKGHRIVLHYFESHESALDIKEELEKKYDTEICILQANFEKEETYSQLVDKIFNHFGRLDCVVANAAIFEYDDIFNNSQELWERHLKINLRAPLVISQAFAKRFEEKIQNLKASDKSHASNTSKVEDNLNIIYLIDQRVLNLSQCFLSYTVSKAALWTLTQTLALALAPLIRVNAIGPGPILKSHYQTAEDFKKQYQKTPLQQEINLFDIAKAIEFIINTRSITGQMISIDGGQHLK
jgi:NAD(P)-dependent dehydrogenase (short-subunit alcohol dehydrogenase family)